MSKTIHALTAPNHGPPQSLSVAIQGYRGAFHDIAAQKYFGIKTVHINETDTFDEIVNKVINRQVDFGAMAIENTIYGMLMPNFNLLHRSKVFIDGEVSLRIKQKPDQLARYYAG
jgi:prephenate dehydratase